MNNELNWNHQDIYKVYGDGSFNYKSKMGVSCSVLYYNDRLFGKELIRGYFEDSLEVEIVSAFWMLKYIPKKSKVYVFNDCSGVASLYDKHCKTEEKLMRWIEKRRKNQKDNVKFNFQILELFRHMKELEIVIKVSNQEMSDNIKICDRASREYLKTRKKSTFNQLVIIDDF